MARECERCGSTENVRMFYHFTDDTTEFLCWDHRGPLVRERATQGGVDRSDDEGTATDERDEDANSGREDTPDDEGNGQSSLMDF